MPYHEPWSLMDVFSGDSQEQDGSQCKQQQHDWDSTSEAMSHEVNVSSEPPSLWPGWKFKPGLNSAGRKVASESAQMLSQPACDSHFTSCLPRVLHFT